MCDDVYFHTHTHTKLETTSQTQRKRTLSYIFIILTCVGRYPLEIFISILRYSINHERAVLSRNVVVNEDYRRDNFTASAVAAHEYCAYLRSEL